MIDGYKSRLDSVQANKAQEWSDVGILDLFNFPAISLLQKMFLSTHCETDSKRSPTAISLATKAFLLGIGHWLIFSATETAIELFSRNKIVFYLSL